MNYDLDYFIKKFEAIPEEKWIEGVYINRGKCCALGHCGERSEKGSDEADALNRLLHCDTILINDGEMGEGNTPRERILNALYKLKNHFKEQ